MEYLNFKSSSNGSVDCAYLLMDSLILHKGHVVHVIDPSSFWMRIGVDADFKEFDDYQKTLNKFYNEMGRKDNVSVDTLALGDCVVVADTSSSQISVDDDDEDEDRTDFHWNRAKVSRMDGDKVDVFYIDLGYTEIVDMSRVKNINKKLFDYVPSQAIQLGIAGIRPLARSWTSRAVNMFASKVLDQEVLVCLIDYDEVSKYGLVVIYIQYDSCRWRSLTHAMLDEDLGLPFEPKTDEFLSQEEVLAALARGEQDSSLNSCGHDSSRSENAEVSLNETDSRENLLVAKPGQSESSWEPGQQLQPDGFSTPIPPHHLSSNSENAGAQVPAFDLSSLVHTKSLSLSKMQEDKFEEQRLLTRAKLEQELKDNEEDDNGEHEIDWGKSDLWIGEAGAFSDFDNIRQEIYKHFDHPDENDFHEFFYKTTEIQRENPLAKFSFVEEQNDKEKTPRDCIEKVDLKPLTEMEDYEIQKKIKEILSGKDGGELNMVCVLINSIIEPDLTIPCDRLIAVLTAILETLVHNSDIDPLIALGALETYLGTSAFETAITTVLKSLRCSCVKLPQTKRSNNSHSAFTELLVTLFIRAGNWPPSSCLLIHEFVMASLERWVIFNKQRAQNSDSCTDLEKLYLECVEVFFDGTGEMLRQRFPDHFCSLIDEMKHKLLHDSTQRIIREQLLNILLKAQAQVPLSTPKSASMKRDMCAQTEPSSDYPSRKDNEDSDQMRSAVDEDINTIDDLDCLEIVGSRFHNSSSSNTSISWYDESCDDEESLDNADTISDTHSLNTADTISDENSVDNVAGCNIADSDSKPSASVTFSNTSHSVLTGNNTGLPKSSQGVSPHLQGEHISDDSFQEDITAGDTSNDLQQITSEEFNANIAGFTCSASQSLPKQEGQEEKTQSGGRLETHVTKGERCDVNPSKPHGVTAEKQNVYKLNVSAPEFTPKLPSSLAKLDQASVFLSSIDGYRAGLGPILVMPSGCSNSDLIRPIQCDMENENAVEEDSLCVGFGKEGMDQQKDIRGSNNETYATVSDPEKASEHHSPPPLGITNEENISSHSSEKAVGHVGMISQEIISSSPVKVVGSIGIINQGDIIGPPSPVKVVGSIGIINQGDIIGPPSPEKAVGSVEIISHSDIIRSPSSKETVGSVGLINQSDIFGSPSPEKAVKSVGVNNQRDIIKYTAKELKALNPGTTSAYLIDVSVTEESSAADHVVKTAENQADQQETDVRSSPSAVPYRRYTGKGDSPLEISFGPKSNSVKWKSLSELLPPSNLKSGQFAVKPSLHPEPISCEIIDAVLHASEKANPNSLQSIAQSLFPTKDQPVSENDYMGCNESRAFPAKAGDSSGREVNSCEHAEAKIVRGLNDAGHAAVPEWPEALFRSVGLAEDNTQSTFAPKKNEKRKAKKKIKFRPASEVLAEKSGDNCDENKMPMPDVDDEGCRIEAEVEDNEVGGHVIHQPKLGALCSSFSKRSSWLTEVKQERPRADKWVPGKRKCTRCGSTDHTIYDCPQEDPFQRPSNQAYFL